MFYFFEVSQKNSYSSDDEFDYDVDYYYDEDDGVCGCGWW
jgi:hypothetical protein